MENVEERPAGRVREIGSAPPLLPRQRLRTLHRLDSWRSCGHVAVEWVLILAAVAGSQAFGHPLVYLVTVVWIGSRQHALFLLAHDGAHRLLHPNRWWNDRLSELCLAWPLLVPFQSYRKIHVLHHRHLNSEADPDWRRNHPAALQAGRSWMEFARITLGLSAGQFRVLDFFVLGRTDASTGRAALSGDRPRVVLYAVIVGVATTLGWLPLLAAYWLVPLFTWFLVVMRLKGLAEHYAVEGAAPANASRTTLPTWSEALLVAPKNVGYHIEHHLFPGVPFYRLPKLHRQLMENEAFRERAHVTRGYGAFVLECLAARGRGPDPSRGAGQ